MKYPALAVLLAVAVLSTAPAQTRPPVTGIAHAAFFVSDIDKARQFYKDYLGFAEPFDLKNPDGSLSLTFIKLNDRQYVELFPEREKNSDRLHHISIETTDAEAMRVYLAAHGVKVPARIGTTRIGNRAFNIQDPDGHTVEITEYVAGSRSALSRGHDLPATRISDYMAHYGILVGSLDAARRFYGGILGFEETWRGSRDGKVLNWTNMKVPDGEDYIEFMLYDKLPEPTQRGSAHHICLFVPDIQHSAAILKTRKGYDKPLEIRTGINRKRQLNLFDPDGTRVELMEPRTIDGVPTPASNAAPPR